MFSFTCGTCRTRDEQGKLLVDAVTSVTLKSPSRVAERELVDVLNDGSEELMREVVRHLRSKLEESSVSTQLLALHALDAAFKGCGRALHDMMASKDLLDAVVRLVVSETLQARPRREPQPPLAAEVDEEVRSEARKLVQSWARSTRLEPFQEALGELANEPSSSAFASVRGAKPAAGAWRAGKGAAAAPSEAGWSESEEEEGRERDELLKPRSPRGKAAGERPSPAHRAASGAAAAAAAAEAGEPVPHPLRGMSPELRSCSSPELRLREGAESPPHIGNGMVRSPSIGGARARSSLSPGGRGGEGGPASATAAIAKLPFASSDPEEAALLAELLASNLKEEAEALYEAGHLEAAERVFTQALLYAPGEKGLLCGRAQCGLARSQFASAAVDAERLTRQWPEWHVGHALLAQALGAPEKASRSDLVEALRAAEEGLRLLEREDGLDGEEQLAEYAGLVAALNGRLL